MMRKYIDGIRHLIVSSKTLKIVKTRDQLK